MNPEQAKEMSEVLGRLAKGDFEIADLVGLTSTEKVKILQHGMAQMKTGRNEEAVSILEGLVALDNANPLYRQYFGLALERAGHHDRALDEYTANINGLETLGNPDRLCEGYLLRARLRAQEGLIEEAADDLLKSKQHDTGQNPGLSERDCSDRTSRRRGCPMTIKKLTAPDLKAIETKAAEGAEAAKKLTDKEAEALVGEFPGHVPTAAQVICDLDDLLLGRTGQELERLDRQWVGPQISDEKLGKWTQVAELTGDLRTAIRGLGLDDLSYQAESKKLFQDTMKNIGLSYLQVTIITTKFQRLTEGRPDQYAMASRKIQDKVDEAKELGELLMQYVYKPLRDDLREAQQTSAQS